MDILSNYDVHEDESKSVKIPEADLLLRYIHPDLRNFLLLFRAWIHRISATPEEKLSVRQLPPRIGSSHTNLFRHAHEALQTTDSRRTIPDFSVEETRILRFSHCKWAESLPKYDQPRDESQCGIQRLRRYVRTSLSDHRRRTAAKRHKCFPGLIAWVETQLLESPIGDQQTPRL